MSISSIPGGTGGGKPGINGFPVRCRRDRDAAGRGGLPRTVDRTRQAHFLMTPTASDPTKQFAGMSFSHSNK
jgi:hypothetical protein